MAILISDSFPPKHTISSTTHDPAPNPASDSTDTVRLSEDAQIKLLAQQGETPSEIAQDLGVAAKTVAAYLELTPPPPPVSEPQSGPTPAASVPAM